MKQVTGRVPGTALLRGLRPAVALTVLAALTTVTPTSVARTAPTETISFAHVSDTHIFQSKGVSAEIISTQPNNRISGESFSKFLRTVPSKYDLQFVVHSGDAVDGYDFTKAREGQENNQIPYLKSILRKSRVPVFVALGNHDVARYSPGGKKLVGDQSIAGEARAEWIQSTDSFKKGSFYSFEKSAGETRYRFLVLDNGYYGGPLTRGSPGHKRVQHLDYAQVYWLFKELQAHPDDIPVLVMHVPLGDDAMSQQIKDALRLGSNAPVALALVGHMHISDAIDDIDLDKGRTIVQIRTTAFVENANNWRRIDLTAGCAWISRADDPDTPQRIVKIKPEANGCSERSHGR